MPLPIVIAQRLAEQLTALRKDGTLPYLRPDGKTQFTIEYDADNRPVRVDTVVLSSQHDEDTELGTLESDVKKHVIDPVLATFRIPSEGYRLLVNPTGRFVVGGPMGDAGVTGRKIIRAEEHTPELQSLIRISYAVFCWTTQYLPATAPQITR